MTIKEIARQAGVSIASVSNVINGNYHKVSDETRKKIETIIRETDYRPNDPQYGHPEYRRVFHL